MLIFNTGIMIWWIFKGITDDYHKFNGDGISDEFVKNLFRKGNKCICVLSCKYKAFATPCQSYLHTYY